MIMHFEGGRWYIDIRTPQTSDQLSFDLAYTLPRRLAAGKVLVVTDNTKVFLSVIRKRWMRLLYEVECQRSSTLDRSRKAALQFEADQMRACRFSSKPPAAVPNANVYFLTPAQLPPDFPPYMTLYAVIPLTPAELTRCTHPLRPGGLAVMYGPWAGHYGALLQQLNSGGPPATIQPTPFPSLPGALNPSKTPQSLEPPDAPEKPEPPALSS
jgi:hypothetical protein